MLLIQWEAVAGLRTLREISAIWNMSEVKVISLVLLIAFGFFFSIREWRKWLALEDPDMAVRDRAILYSGATTLVIVGCILAELGSTWHWAKVISHNFEWVMISALLLWLLVRDWSKWMALKEPDTKIRNRAILNTVVTLTLGILVYYTEFC